MTARAPSEEQIAYAGWAFSREALRMSKKKKQTLIDAARRAGNQAGVLFEAGVLSADAVAAVPAAGRHAQIVVQPASVR